MDAYFTDARQAPSKTARKLPSPETGALMGDFLADLAILARNHDLRTRSRNTCHSSSLFAMAAPSTGDTPVPTGIHFRPVGAGLPPTPKLLYGFADSAGRFGRRATSEATRVACGIRKRHKQV